MTIFSRDPGMRIGKSIERLLMVAILIASARGQARDPQVLRIAALGGSSQMKALRSALIGPITHAGFHDTVFYCEARLRGSLRRLVSDRKTGVEAAYFLSLIADPDDLLAIIRRPPPHRLLGDPWAYRVAWSLIDASDEEEWRFLHDCLMGKYGDPWASRGAIQTLKMAGSPQSLAILEEAQRANLTQGEEIAHAIAYANAPPPPFRGSSLEEVARRLAQTPRAGSAEMPRYNAAGDKALVHIRVTAGRDLLIYTASFWRAEGNWGLQGLQEVAKSTSTLV